MLGLGRELRARGHRIRFASTPEFAHAAERAGLSFQALEGIPGTTEHPDYYHPTRSVGLVSQRLLAPALEPVYRAASSVGTESLVIANCHCYGARVAQERHGIPLVSCVVSPFHLRSVERLPILPGAPCPTWAPRLLRRAFLHSVSRFWDGHLQAPVNCFRAKLGLRPVRDIWYDWALSPQRVLGLFPAWYAPNPGDWPSQFLHGDFAAFDQTVPDDIPERLTRPGDPVVVFAAGSAGSAAHDFFRAAIAASTGQRWRAVLLTGHNAPDISSEVPENVTVFKYLPLSKLLRYAAAAVHHGGLGSISLALGAGVPQVALPFGHDQFDNSARLEALGVGSTVSLKRNVTSELRRRIKCILDDASTAERARRAQQSAMSAAGLPAVCAQIERDYRDFRRSSVGKFAA